MKVKLIGENQQGGTLAMDLSGKHWRYPLKKRKGR